MWRRVMDEADQAMERGYIQLVEAEDPVAARQSFMHAHGLLYHRVVNRPDDAAAWDVLLEIACLLGVASSARGIAERLMDLAGANPHMWEDLTYRAIHEMRDEEVAREAYFHWMKLDPRAASLGIEEELAHNFPENPYLSDADLLELRAFLHDRGVVQFDDHGPIHECMGEPLFTYGWLTLSKLDPARGIADLERRGSGRCDCDVLLHANTLRPVDSLTAWKAFAVRRRLSHGEWSAQRLLIRAERVLVHDPDEALSLLDEAWRKASYLPRVVAARAAAHARVGRNREALRDAREALELSPGQPETRALCARLLAQQGLFAEAAEQFEWLARTDRHSWPPPSSPFLSTGESGGAESSGVSGMGSVPSMVDAAVAAVACWLVANRHDRAREMYRWVREQPDWEPIGQIFIERLIRLPTWAAALGEDPPSEGGKNKRIVDDILHEVVHRQWEARLDVSRGSHTRDALWPWCLALILLGWDEQNPQDVAVGEELRH